MEMKKKTPNAQRPTFNIECRAAFTLIELLVVIAIIAALLGLAFPVFQGVLDRAKKVQAKNDVTQIVTAVNAFYTEYGKYPLVTAIRSMAPATLRVPICSTVCVPSRLVPMHP
jgi:prepilin-type N-terminal cleavage/methylation domain-containing protein